DAEERPFPLLPSRERVVTSRMIALDGNVKKSIASPEGLDNVAVEAATLQIDPQLALPILRSIPFLVQYPCESTDAVIDRFVPLSVVSALFQKHPELAKGLEKMPKRKTRHESWDRNDPRRLTQLLETPWERESRGGIADDGKLIDILDSAV